MVFNTIQACPRARLVLPIFINSWNTYFQITDSGFVDGFNLSLLFLLNTVANEIGIHNALEIFLEINQKSFLCIVEFLFSHIEVKEKKKRHYYNIYM